MKIPESTVDDPIKDVKIERETTAKITNEVDRDKNGVKGGGVKLVTEESDNVTATTQSGKTLSE